MAEDLGDARVVSGRIAALLGKHIGFLEQMMFQPLIEHEVRLCIQATQKKAREDCALAARQKYVYDLDVVKAKEVLIDAVKKSQVVRPLYG